MRIYAASSSSVPPRSISPYKSWSLCENRQVRIFPSEVNLTRLVGLLTMLRDSSQLIIITHQKFTMESADALYGVSMRGDGITQVISQRIRRAEPEPTDVPAAQQVPALP